MAAAVGGPDRPPWKGAVLVHPPCTPPVVLGGGGLEVVEYSPSLPVWGSLTLRPEDEDPLPCPGTSSCARLQAGWECQSWGFGPGLLLAPCPSSPVRMFLLVYIFYWK